jgi:hypothetical protein
MERLSVCIVCGSFVEPFDSIFCPEDEMEICCSKECARTRSIVLSIDSLREVLEADGE